MTVEAELTVVEREMVSDSVVALTLAAARQEPLPPWEPGAHVELELGPGLVRQVWPVGALHVERFRAAGDEAKGDAQPFEVELKRSGHTLAVPADRSVLEVVEEAGVAVLSSCREGTCGTCETEVLEGEPEHRDALLTPEEQAACDTMMICVSRSRSARLVLDL